ncbi:hypothetical protein TNCV_3403671 [Trichonephila clavipes]|nr:hypothetical protein TNCV_3403671 [Trichonephila clavipes]
MAAIEQDPDVRSNGRGMQYQANHLQEHRNAPEPHHAGTKVSVLPLMYCIRLCYCQTTPWSSSIVKIGCSQFVVQLMDDIDIGRTAERISTDLLPSNSFHAEIVEIDVVSPSIVPSGNFAELNRTVTCMVLKANDRRTSTPMPR